MCSGQLETFAIVVIGMAAQCSTTMNGGTHPLSMHIYISYGVYSIHHTFSVFCTHVCTLVYTAGVCILDIYTDCAIATYMCTHE